MRKILFPLALAGILLVATFGIYEYARGQSEKSTDGGNILKSETQDGNSREITAPAGAVDQPLVPNIGFIDSPTGTCYQPDVTQDSCNINWYYLAVDAGANYMITMTVMLNDYGIVSSSNGFFQTSMYVPYNMLGQGFKVPCGTLGAGGSSKLGNAYAYTIRARDSANLGSANYGTVYCPAYQP
jgi:hypothetical protein